MLDCDDFKLPATEVGVPVAAEMVGDIEPVAREPILLAGEFSPGGSPAPGDSAEAAGTVVVFEREAHVAVGEDARRGEESGSACDEEGIWIAETKRRKLFKGGEEVRRELGEPKLEIEPQFFGGRCQAQLLGGDAGEQLAELRDVIGGKGKSNGVCVSAEAREECTVGLLVRGAEGVE